MVKVLLMPNIPFTIKAPTTPDLEPVEHDYLALPSSDGDSGLAAPLKVSELVSMLKADVEKKHRFVRVVGEISSFKQWRSGHCYFDIKDEQTVLPAVMFRPHFLRVPFAVKDGLQILFSGRMSIYTANAKLQMCVESMEPLGQGALALAFEQLKSRLKAEGLFDPQHKKPIKSFNQCVGLITSSHGAVLRDMVRILKNRMPGVDILFSPVRVQGAGAASEIKNAIQLLDQTGACDVIIVGRGGGSLEDLWPFNEEMVARAIFLAQTPIISAVGHETDFSISDFVADVRAATPTHAATLVVPELVDLVAELSGALATLRLKQRASIKDAELKLAHHKKSFKDPRILLFRHWQRLDDHGKRLHEHVASLIKSCQQTVAKLKNRLSLCAPFRTIRIKREALFAAQSLLVRLSPAHKLPLYKRDLVAHRRSLDGQMSRILIKRRKNLEEGVVKLEALSPLKVLVRGYSLVEAEDGGRILSKTADFYADQTIRIRVEDGVVRAKVSAPSRIS
jgi:exodeoxyribonuclease VII large subunit